MKKILSLLLIASFAIFSSSALAEEEISAAEAAVETAEAAPLSGRYNLLVNLGIISGDDMKKPSDELVSRAEAAIVMCNLLQLPVTDYSGERIFRDVMADSVEEAGIYAAVNQKLMKPLKDNYFYPSYPITKAELAEAVCMSLGYGDIVELRGALAIASDNRLFKNVSSADKLTREDFYAIIYNALEMPVMEITGVSADGQAYGVDKGNTLLYSKYEIAVEKGIITMAGGLELDKKGRTSSDNRIKIGGTVFMTDKALAPGEYLGRNVKCYYYYNSDVNAVAYIEQEKNNVIEFDGDGAVYSNMQYTLTDENGKKNEYKLEMPYVIYNNSIYSGTYSQSVFEPANGNVMLVDNDDDEKYEIVFIYSYTDYVVKMANEELKMISDYFGNGAKYNDDAVVTVYDKSGRTITFGDLTDKVIASVLETDDKVDIYASSETIEGRITGIDNEGREILTINDTQYKVSKYLTDAIARGDILKYTMYSDYVFYLNMFGEIVYFGEKTGFVKSTAYGIAVAAASADPMSPDPYQIRIFSKHSGGFENYNVAEKVILNNKAGQKYEDVYESLCKDGQAGTDTGAFVPQLVEFALNDDGAINLLRQVGGADSPSDTLKLELNGVSANGRSLAYREILICDDPDGLYYYDTAKPAQQIGYNTSYTESLQVPYRDGKIATDREDLFAIYAIPRASYFDFYAYSKDRENSLMADFVILPTSADSALTNGNKFSPLLVVDMKPIIRDEEAMWEITTETKKYYVDSKYDLNAIPLYDKSNNLVTKVENGQTVPVTHKLRPGDIIILQADANDNVTVIEVVYDYENDEFVGWYDKNRAFARNSEYYLSHSKLIYQNNNYILTTFDKYEDYDPDKSKISLSLIPSNAYYYDAEEKKVRKATKADYISMKDSPTDYMKVFIHGRYETVTKLFIMPQNRKVSK